MTEAPWVTVDLVRAYLPSVTCPRRPIGSASCFLGAPRQIPLASTIHLQSTSFPLQTGREAGRQRGIMLSTYQQKIRSKHQPMSQHYKLSFMRVLPASRPKELVDLFSSQGPQNSNQPLFPTSNGTYGLRGRGANAHQKVSIGEEVFRGITPVMLLH